MTKFIYFVILVIITNSSKVSRLIVRPAPPPPVAKVNIGKPFELIYIVKWGTRRSAKNGEFSGNWARYVKTG
jgi:hypothetical protein